LQLEIGNVKSATCNPQPAIPSAAAVIVAAGSGKRMGTDVAKQYLELAGRPVLAHVVEVFDAAPEIGRIVLVLPEADIPACRERIIAPLGLRTPIDLAVGGPERQASVANGLECLASLGDQTVVLIHDGVRPFVDAALIRRLIRTATRSGACIPAIPLTETVKRVDREGMIVGSPDRGALRLAQTPQAFTLGVIRSAHRAAHHSKLAATDDAALVEAVGLRVQTIAGSRFNLKITVPEDLALAHAILTAGLWPPGNHDTIGGAAG
jgi:2-C-methyl-D-erythritol 4-phosphate cytidylyltransferase